MFSGGDTIVAEGTSHGVGMSAVQEVRAEDTLGILGMPGVDAHRSSAGLGWSRMYLSVQRELPYQADFGGVDNHLLILHLDGPVSVTRGKGRAAQTRMIGSGGLFLHPAHRELSVRLSGRLRTLHVYLDSSMVNDAAGRDVQLAEEIGSTDPLLEQLMLSLDTALQSYTDASRLYVDSLGTAVAAQLAERHSSRARSLPPVPRPRGLGDRQLSTAVDLMHQHLQEGLSLGELASSVGLSESQFARAFRTRVMRAWLDTTPGALRASLR